MKEKLQVYLDLIDDLSVRERVILQVTALAILFGIWDLLLYSSLDVKRAELGREIRQIQNNINDQLAEAEVLLQANSIDPNKEIKEEKKRLEVEVSGLKQQLSRLSLGLVPSEKLPRILEDILRGNGKLTLVSLQTKPVEAFLLNEKSPQPANRNALEPNALVAGRGLFKHAVTIELEGRYFDTVDYLQSLEELPWRFYWDNLRYDVSQYPKAKISVDVYTLSAEEGAFGA